MTTFSGNSRRAVALLCVAQFVVVLDVTVVTTALPALGHELRFTPQGLTWVVTAYTLCFGGFLVVGGRVADLLGSRRAFTVGLAGFTAASLLCALAWSAGVLIAFRAMQGSAAALLSPAALALLTASTEEGAGRRRAVGVWTAAAAGGGATGWLLGGLLTEYADWRWVFGINVPVGLAVLPLVAAVLPRVPRQREAQLDVVGAAGVTVGLASIVYGLTEAPAVTAHPMRALLPLLLGAGLLAVVLRRERRLPDPLLPAGLLAVRAVRGANLTAAAVTASTSPAMYLAVLYVQNVLHLPPGRAAGYFPVLNLTVIVGSLLGPRLLAGLTARWTAAGGFALIAAGCLVLTTLPAAGLPTGRLLTAFGLMGTGLGLASTASTAVGTEAAPAAHRGVAAGLLNATAQIGTALGLALVAPLAALSGGVGGEAGGEVGGAAGAMDTGGMWWGFAAAGLIAGLGLAGSRLLPARRHGERDRAGTRAEAAR
jgi:MFS family permease